MKRRLRKIVKKSLIKPKLTKTKRWLMRQTPRRIKSR